MNNLCFTTFWTFYICVINAIVNADIISKNAIENNHFSFENITLRTQKSLLENRAEKEKWIVHKTIEGDNDSLFYSKISNYGSEGKTIKTQYSYVLLHFSYLKLDRIEIRSVPYSENNLSLLFNWLNYVKSEISTIYNLQNKDIVKIETLKEADYLQGKVNNLCKWRLGEESATLSIIKFKDEYFGYLYFY